MWRSAGGEAHPGLRCHLLLYRPSRQARAKFTLEVCSSAPCRVKDSDTLLERLKRLLNLEVGQVTYDGRFSIEQVPCFRGPATCPPPCGSTAWYTAIWTSEERILDMLQQLN